MMTLSLFNAPFSSINKAYADENKTVLQKDFGFFYDGTDWYYLNVFGQKITGWITGIDGYRYYLDPFTAKLKTGWFLDQDGRWYFLNNQSDGTKGRALTGWQWIDGYCYYFDAYGKMLYNTTIQNLYFVNSNGQWTNWDGTVNHIKNKGYITKQVLGASRIVPAKSYGSSGSDSDNDSDNDNSYRYNTPITPATESKKTDSYTNEESDSKQETRSHEQSHSQQETKSHEQSGSKEESDKSSKNITVINFKRPKLISVPYKGSADKTLEYIQERINGSGVTFYLSNNKQTTAAVTEWEINGDAESGKTITASPKNYKIASRYADIKSEFYKFDISLPISIESKSTDDTPVESTAETPTTEETSIEESTPEETTSESSKHPDNWTITGYEAIDAIELDYIDNNLSSYKKFFPKSVTFNTSDGTKITIDAKWNGYSGKFESGGEIKVFCNNDYTDLPVDVRNDLMESFENIEKPTLTIKFKKTIEDETKKEVTITLDREPEVKGTYDKYQYDYTDNITLNLDGYDGDGSNVLIKAAHGYSKSLNELGYSTSDKSITLPVSEFMPNGITDYFWLNVLINGKNKFQSQILVNTDRIIKFNNDTKRYISIYKVSKKKDFEATISFENVPIKDIDTIKFISGSKDLTDVFKLIKIDKNNYKFRIPLEYIKENKSQRSIDFVIKCYAAFPVNVILYMMPDPSLSTDKYDNYYATENPVIKFNNFSLDKCKFDDLKISIKENESDASIRDLVKDVDYKINEDKSSITLISNKILGTASLDEDKQYILLVKALEDDETAETTISYKKDRTLEVVSKQMIIPGQTIYLNINNLNYNEKPDDIEVYFGDKKLDGCIGIYKNYSNQIKIPYASIADHITDNKIRLTIKKPNLRSTDITLNIPEFSGDPAPFETAFTNEYGSDPFDKQDDIYPIFSETGSVYIKVTDTKVSEDILSSSVVVVHKKGTDISTGVSAYIDKCTAIVKKYNTNEKWLKFSLYSSRDELGEIEMNGDKYPVYTLTVYTAGYSPKDIDVCLKPSDNYY